MDYKTFFQAVAYVTKKRYQYNEEIRKLNPTVTEIISDVQKVCRAYIGEV